MGFDIGEDFTDLSSRNLQASVRGRSQQELIMGCYLEKLCRDLFTMACINWVPRFDLVSLIEKRAVESYQDLLDSLDALLLRSQLVLQVCDRVLREAA